MPRGRRKRSRTVSEIAGAVITAHATLRFRERVQHGVGPSPLEVMPGLLKRARRVAAYDDQGPHCPRDAEFWQSGHALFIVNRTGGQPHVVTVLAVVPGRAGVWLSEPFSEPGFNDLREFREEAGS